MYTGSRQLPGYEASDDRGFRSLHPTGADGNRCNSCNDAGFAPNRRRLPHPTALPAVPAAASAPRAARHLRLGPRPGAVDRHEYYALVEPRTSSSAPCWAAVREVRDERHKDACYVCYARGDRREQLSGPTEDPGELVGLAADARSAALLDRFRALLAEQCAGTGDLAGRFVPAPDAHAPDGG
ncbi:hypothetical protein ACFZCK_29460 [Kitasatospora purpeofusca]|uniref:hypothetical protein n=1 Tax=Kitasatospora purpeofusca TaxID=67352 RepID=UPI0036E13C7F